ncbi:hypothetical protein SLEP1_g56735 [Rubroshorea leprosula]|uniref:DUF4218 domain-containing protein n=1 Tax=Rubroshorea leprosula TaxID=152421 RepID=A0AAV5MN40_9ROSI|nr:hypothetical protein SLEP1_g56735 [Rubroshorea leprosula]
MHKLKQTIGNKNHVDVFIVEACILNEITGFCSRYFGADLETSWSKPPRNFAAVPFYRNTEFSIFACPGHPMGSHSQTRCLTTQEMKAAELYVLLNCREVDALLSIFDREVGVYMTPFTPHEAHTRSFVMWFKDKDTYVSECSTTYGSGSALWPPRDNDAWATAVEGCHSNFMPGIGSQASLSQQFAAFSAYGMRSPSATPSLPYTGQAFPLVGTSFLTVGPSFHASGPSFPHAMPMQMLIELAFPMGQMGRQSGSPGASSANPL